MERIAKFEKVSFGQFLKDAAKAFYLCNTEDLTEENISKMHEIYDKIKLPVRATRGSAGYDFSTPFELPIPHGASVKVPTGIRVKIKEGWVLQIFPRSSLGFKYRLQLDNTVGIIDSDYYESDNEGHIFIKITNDSIPSSFIRINEGDRFAQGIFLPYGITEDDDVDAVRNGGYGSTGN